MRDWSKTLLKASFRGVPFWVDSDEYSGGRRAIAHEIAGGEFTPTEDLGIATRTYDITAYTVGDLADLQAKAFVAAAETPGPGFVVLPIYGGFMAQAQGCRVSRQKDRMGYMSFDITFLPSPGPQGLVLSVGSVSVAVASGVGLAAAAFGQLF